METGIKLNLTKTIRSPKTFENGQHEYLFDHEVEFETGNAPRQNYCTGTDAHI